MSYFDERFTTVHAEDALWNAGLTHKRRKDRRDIALRITHYLAQQPES